MSEVIAVSQKKYEQGKKQRLRPDVMVPGQLYRLRMRNLEGRTQLDPWALEFTLRFRDARELPKGKYLVDHETFLSKTVLVTQPMTMSIFGWVLRRHMPFQAGYVRAVDHDQILDEFLITGRFPEVPTEIY